MSVVSGTIQSVTLATANSGGVGARKTYRVAASFPAQTSSNGGAQLLGIGAYIASETRNGKTNTLRRGLSCEAGLDANGVAVYTGAITVSGDNATFLLTDATETELASAAASSGVEFIFSFDES